jgi:hypothetical protein
MEYFFILSFLVLGAGIKFIDAAYDEKAFDKRTALIVAPLLGILWAYTMYVDAVAATILCAILCGVLLKGKIDNWAHLAGLGVIGGVLIVSGVKLLFLPLIVLAIAALLDEVGNDAIDKRRTFLLDKGKAGMFVLTFFDHRWVLKVAILALAVISVIPLLFFFAMICFDYAYLGMRWYSHVRLSRMPSHATVPDIDLV